MTNVLQDVQQKAIGLTYLLNRISPASVFGKQKLTNIQLFTPSEQQRLENYFDNQERLILAINENQPLIDNIRHEFMQLKNIDVILLKSQNETLCEVDFFELKRFLLTLHRLYPYLKKIITDYAIKTIHIEPFTHCLNIVDPTQKRNLSFVVDHTFSDQLKNVQVKKQDVEEQIRKNPTTYLHELRLKLVVNESHLINQTLQQLTAKLTPYFSQLTLTINNLATLDVLIAKSQLAIDLKATRPVFCQRGPLEFRRMFNPMIEETVKKTSRRFTKSDIELIPGATIITGANMGGKSVAIKTMVLNVTLAHLGIFTCTSYARLPMFDEINLIAGDLENTQKGLSSFAAEIYYLNQCINVEHPKNSFIAIDEFANGTNPTEGAILLRELANYFNEVQTTAVMTTHYELENIMDYNHYQSGGLKKEPLQEVLMHHTFDDMVKTLYLYMDYRLRKVENNGKLAHSALQICELLQLNPVLLNKIKKSYQVINEKNV